MATRTKTVIYAFPALASLTNNTLTNLTQITLYLPESSKTFRSVTAHITFDDIITVTGGTLTTKTLNCRVGAASYTSVANANTLTNSGENASFYLTANYTSHFTSNWTGTSMTCDFQVQINQSTGTTLGMVNVCVTLEITYEYDDTSTTHVKTVIIPLDAPDGALTTGAVTYDTMPALGYYLAEAGKTFRGIYLVVEGNEHRNAATTDHTMTLYAGTANVTTGNYEGALASDRMFRYVWDVTSAWPSTTATQVFQALSSVARVNHFCAYLIVTYEFEADNTSTTLTEDLDTSETGVDVTAASNLGTVPFVISIDNEQMLVTSIASNTLTVTRGYNSTTAAAHSNGATVRNCITNSVQLALTPQVMLPGTTSSEYGRLKADLFITEPGPITGGKMAGYFYWAQAAAISGLNFRLGTGSFVTKTDAASVLCGGNSCMERNDSAYTLARGKNTLSAFAYRTDTADFGHGLSGWMAVTYISTQPTDGVGAGNRTIRRNISTNGTGAAAAIKLTSATAVEIAESGYLISNVGTELLFQMSGTTAPTYWHDFIERLSTGGEGGVDFEPGATTSIQSDAEVGWWRLFGNYDYLFKKWPAQSTGDRVDIETARRYQQYRGTGWDNICTWVTYSSMAFTIDGDITDSGGGTVNIYAHRKSDGELLASTSRSGDGAYSISWYENVDTLFVDAYESASFVGRSEDAVANGTA